MIFLKLKVKIFFIIIIIFFLATIYNYYFHEVKDECIFSSENVEKSYYLKANKLLKKEGIKLFLYDSNTMKYYEAKRPYEIFYSLVHVSGDIMIAKKQKRKACYINVLVVSTQEFPDELLEELANTSLDEVESYLK